MTPPNPRGDPGVTFHPSNPAHPVVTQGIQMHTSSSTFCQNILLKIFFINTLSCM